MRNHYDEMHAAPGEVRGHDRALAEWLASTPVERVTEKRTFCFTGSGSRSPSTATSRAPSG